jgi:hypothetical protein
MLSNWIRDPFNLYQARFAATQISTWLICNLPQYVFIGGALTVLLRRRKTETQTLSAAILFLGFIPFFWLAAHVQRNTHPYSMAIFSMLLGVMLWGNLSRNRREGRVVRTGLALAALVYAMGLLTQPSMSLFRAAYELPQSRTLGIPGTQGIRVSRASYEAYRPIYDFVRRNVPPDEPIYVGVQRHDAIVINDLRFYYLLRRRGSGPHYELHPGIADSEQNQQAMIRAIDRHGVRCVVLWRFGWSDDVLDRIKARRMAAVEGLGATSLDEFLGAAFEPIGEYDQYVLLWRRGVPVDEGPGSAGHKVHR